MAFARAAAALVSGITLDGDTGPTCRRVVKAAGRTSVVCCALATVLAAGCGSHVDKPPLPPLGSGWWHTQGITIRDSHDRMVRIAAATWFGAETTFWVPDGLDYQPYQEIMRLAKRIGLNAIRLTFSNQLVEQNPIVTQHVNANRQFLGKHALFVMDSIVSFARKIGLKIILDDQRSAAAPSWSVASLNEPLWYWPGYPETSWIHDWQFLARRYRHNDAVIGFDLRNEPHTGGPGPWSVQTYLNQGATWGPYNGADNPATDWRDAAVRAGNAVLAINPHLLMFVEGTQQYPDPSLPSGVDSYWWAGILRGVRSDPVVFKVPHQLVYSPHEYGPIKIDYPFFQNMTYGSMVHEWDSQWGFILNPHASYAAPIWIGEMGTCTKNPGCVTLQQPGNQATWLHIFIRFLKRHPYVGWGIWALNGSNSLDEPAGNGILNAHWNGVADPAYQRLLDQVGG